MKFKVGDKVRVKEWKDVLKECGVDKDHSSGVVYLIAKAVADVCGLVFTVTECNETMRYYSISGLNRFGEKTELQLIEELLEPVCDARILITTDGKVTLARLYEDGEVKKSARAECSPDDTFDFSLGAKLAFERLTKTTPAERDKHQWVTNKDVGLVEEPAEPKYYSGKVVCVEKKGECFAYTVGKIYEFKDGLVKIDNGRELPAYKIKSLDEWDDQLGDIAKFIEIKE